MVEKQIPDVEAIWKAVYGDEVPERVTCSLGHIHPLRDLQPVTVDQDEKCYQSVDGPDAAYWGLQCPECQGRALNSVPLPLEGAVVDSIRNSTKWRSRMYEQPRTVGEGGSEHGTGPAPVSTNTEVGDLVDQAKHAATKTAGDVETMVRERLDTGYHKAAERLSEAVKNLNEVGTTLDERGNHAASGMVHSATKRAERVTTYLETTTLQDALSAAGDYAKGHAGTVIVGGAALGLVASRLLKTMFGGASASTQSPPTTYQAAL